MYLPSFLRTPCLRVSFSQCRKPTYRPALAASVSLSLALSLFGHLRLSQSLPRSFSLSLPLSLFLSLLSGSDFHGATTLVRENFLVVTVDC